MIIGSSRPFATAACALALVLCGQLASSTALAQPVWTETNELVSGDSQPGDLFGFAMAASGDTVVVGAPEATSAGFVDAGVAYVFVRSGSTWVLQQKLLSSDPSTADFYGSHVAIEGDTIAIGDWADNGQRGAIYVYTRSGVTWTFEAKLTASDADTGDSLGTSIGISGDTIISGAPSDETGALMSTGSVYVFTRSGTVWTEAQKISPPIVGQAFFWGLGLSLSGDRAAISQRDNADGRGAVYIFERTGGVFVQTAKLQPAAIEGGDVFGDRVALDGDRLLASARGDDDVALDAGAAYVFDFVGGSWLESAKLTIDAGIEDERIGALAIALEGDLAVIGSFASPLAAIDGGAAHLFMRETTGDWTNLATLVASNVGDYWAFSSALSIEDGSVFVGARYTEPRPPIGCGPRPPQPACPVAPALQPGFAYEFVIGPIDSDPPVVDVPFGIMNVEATSSAGAEASFSFTAEDEVDGELPVTCDLPSGSTFPLGDTTVICSATDAAGNTGSDSFIVRVTDTTAPDAVCTDVTLECTGAMTDVTTSCTATDAVDASPSITSTAQSSYPVGGDSYTCSAIDDAFNSEAESCSVLVTDTVPPTCVAPGTAFVLCNEKGGISRGNAEVVQHIGLFDSYDLCGGGGGSLDGPLFLPAGCDDGQASTLTYNPRDGAGNTASCSTDVVVYDHLSPLVTVPAPIMLECEVPGGVSASNGNIATWLGDATAYDLCHDEAIGNDAPALFSVGDTSVHFIGEDSCGNANAVASTVSVLDTTAPSAGCQNVLVECSGALTPVTTSCSGSDICDDSLTLTSNAAPSYALGQHPFACTALDGSSNSASASCQISVLDTTAAVIAPISTVTAPVVTGTNVSMSATFTDACGSHTGSWTFGDGTSGPASVTEGAGAGTASASHVYNTAGTYTVTLTLTDAAGNVATRSYSSIVVTAAPPASIRGSVSGAGFISSPRGAYRPSPNSSGVASFTFTASHPLLGGMTPVLGATTFSILLPLFNFTSLSVESLTITGPNAKYRGTGRVNGSNGYSFLMTVVDGQRPSGGGTDRLHLKVWRTSTGVVTYDNEPTVPDSANATAAISLGTINILPY